jgi:hypothetical protein
MIPKEKPVNSFGISPWRATEITIICMMKSILLKVLLLSGLYLLGTAFTQEKWKPLFDGKTLKGWHTIPGGHWSAANGIITGTNDHSDERHGLLVTDKKYKDFEIKLQFKCIKGNSGLYFRVDETGGIEGVKGLQAEIAPEEYIGGLYETGGRAWVVEPRQEDVRKWYKPGQWNKMTVRAENGNIVVHVNGYKTAELSNDPGRKEGFIALQLHGGQDMEVYFKDIMLKEL